ncbi:ATP-dependent DNA helicase [Mycoplasmopsis pullorum]|nr:AAA family ATPase [Mycoplasmopsis pullorum]
MIKGVPAQNWGLFLFKISEGKIKNTSFLVYAKNNLPETFVTYEVVLKDGNYQNNKELVSFSKVILKSEVVFKYLKEVGLDKITLKTIKEKYDNDSESFLNDFKTKKNDLIKLLDKNDVIEKIEQKILFLEEMILFEQNGLGDALVKVQNAIFPDPNNMIPLQSYFKTKNIYNFVFQRKLKFEQVEKIVSLLNLPVGYNNRQIGYLINVLQQLEVSNDTRYKINQVFHEFKKHSEIGESDFSELIKEAIFAGIIIVKQEKDDLWVSLADVSEKEKFIADELIKIDNKKAKKVTYKQDFENIFDKYQFEAFKNAFEHNVSIISGQPGSGKSFLIKGIIETFLDNKYHKKEIVVLAPTGRASSNIIKKTNFKASTIHSFLKLDKDSFDSASNYEAEPFMYDDYKILIIDEFSMVNLDLFHLLLSSCQKLEKVILIGDYNQLPSIGIGYLLFDLIESQKFATTFLKKNHRSDNEEIVKHFLAITDINEVPMFDDRKVKHAEPILSDYIPIIEKTFKEKYKQYGIDNLVILAPQYKNSNGIHNINKAIQKIVNPKSKIITTKNDGNFKINYRMNDRVIQNENRRQDEVYNGDIGYIHDVVYDTKTDKIISISVDFGEDKIVGYTETQFKNEVSLAYAITVHKFQGSESDCVIFIVDPNTDGMLSQKLIYTGISRAKKELIIIGDRSYYFQKVASEKNNKKEVFTLLKHFLKK